jgi:hypothetical protein
MPSTFLILSAGRIPSDGHCNEKSSLEWAFKGNAELSALDFFNFLISETKLLK